jgi:hypothetical protein
VVKTESEKSADDFLQAIHNIFFRSWKISQVEL